MTKTLWLQAPRRLMVREASTTPLNASLTLTWLDGPSKYDRREDGMRKFLRKIWNDKRGNALVMAGAALPLVIGSAGLATDTIQWTLWKRQLQRAADSAAIAGVYAKVQNQTVSEAVADDLEYNKHVNIALQTGYPTIAYPANTSTYNSAVQVGLAVQKKLSFSSMFMDSPPVITANATAAAILTGDYCVVSLENTATTGISASGNTTMNLGCGMITNSTSLNAAVATGSSSVNASPIAAVGGIESSNNWASGTQLLPFTLAQEDPFKDVYPPAASWYPSGQCPQLNVGNNSTVDYSANAAHIGQTLCYREIRVQGTLTLGPSTYVIDGGGLNVQGTLRCTGCTIVLSSRTAATNPSSIGTVDINSSAEVDMIAPASGTYKGLVMYQDRRAPYGTSNNQINHVRGNANSSYQGAFYFPNQKAFFNGSSGMSTACVQLVARIVEFSGNSTITNTCPANSGASSFKGRHVRLIG